MKRFLFFRHTDITYCVHEDGNLTKTGVPVSGNWKFLGVTFHHWRCGIDITCAEAFENPQRIIGGLVWDLDHGTKRQWGGQYNGKLPRITSAWVS